MPIPIPSTSEFDLHIAVLQRIDYFTPKIKPETMKKHLLTAIAILFLPLFLYAQSDKILGTWVTEKGTSAVDIYKGTDGKYNGKISWLEEPLENGKPKVDDENSDPQLAKRPIMGLQILKGFSYDSKRKQWVGGTIYDPDNGKTYDCYAWFEDGNTSQLFIKGYVLGIRALGRSTEWKRR
jgi:uncharacterized protein (DUF2147 family)